MLKKILKFLFLEVQRLNLLENKVLYNFINYLHYSHIRLIP